MTEARVWSARCIDPKRATLQGWRALGRRATPRLRISRDGLLLGTVLHCRPHLTRDSVRCVRPAGIVYIVTLTVWSLGSRCCCGPARAVLALAPLRYQCAGSFFLERKKAGVAVTLCRVPHRRRLASMIGCGFRRHGTGTRGPSLRSRVRRHKHMCPHRGPVPRWSVPRFRYFGRRSSYGWVAKTSSYGWSGKPCQKPPRVSRGRPSRIRSDLRKARNAADPEYIANPSSQGGREYTA